MSTRVLVEIKPPVISEPLNLLIVENSQHDVELLLYELREAGLRLDSTIVESKEQFLEAVARKDFDAVLADFRLPHWTGLDALVELQQAGKDVPFLLVTGTLGEEAAVECIKQGVSDYILKDHISRLPLALKRALREKTLRDENRRAQRALAESECRAREQFAELDLLYRSLPMAIAVFDRDARLLRLNDEDAHGRERFAASRRDLSGSAICPVCTDTVERHIRRVIESGEPLRNLELSTPAANSGADMRHWLVSLHPLRNAEGKIESACALALDISDRRAAEEALRVSEARNRDLVENSVYGIARVAADGRFLDANASLLRILGCAEFSELGALNLVRDIFRYPEQYAQIHAACQKQGLLHGAESEWRRRDGGLVAVRVNLRLIPLGAAGSGLELVVEDVTELRAMERQLRQAQKFEAIGQLAGGIAHDFNNVVGAILGWAELGIDQAGADARSVDRFTRIREQAERAAALTRELLAFARRQVLQPRAVDLNTVITGLVSFLDKVIGRNIELKVRPAQLDAVKADPTQMEQVLMNLCINARDAMPDGGRLVIESEMVELDDAYCRFYPGATPGRYAVLSVSDTGIGMDAETRDRIFEPFFTTKETGKGTGMGLATVYGIVKQHGGLIHVYSEPGQGSLFRVYLPATGDPIAAPSAGMAKSPTLAELRGSETILIAEDHEAIREMARQTLAGLGYKVVCAQDGEEALKVFETEQPSLAVLDMVMPRMGGLAAATRMAGASSSLKILFTSGYAPERPTLQSVPGDTTRYLQKPYSPTALSRMVREMLDQPRPSAGT